jgi:hypothetical protein
VHGSADVNPFNEAMVESHAEGWFVNHGPRIDTVACRRG